MYYKHNEQLPAHILDMLGYMNNFLANKVNRIESINRKNRNSKQTTFLKEFLKLVTRSPRHGLRH